jgi:hypothetical protein
VAVAGSDFGRQELVEFKDHELSLTDSDDETDQEMDAKCIDI